MPASAEILIDHCLTLPRSRAVTSIFMQVTHHVLESKFSHA